MPSVSEPTSVDGAAGLLRQAAADGRRVSIDRPGGDVVLSTAALDRVLEHEAGDLTVTVETGIRLSALDEALAPHGQRLALDAPGDPTVGACLAGNLSGPRRHRFGAPRDLVLGVTAVLGDGTVVHAGGKVVKNVAGYDLAKLLCGSRGELGLIAVASLRLHPRPAAAGTLVVPVASPGEAARAAAAVLRSQLVPSAVDVLWPGRLALLFEGGARAVAAQLAAARALVGGEEDGGVWDEVAERQLAYDGRLSFAPGELESVLASHPEGVFRAGAGSGYVAGPVPDTGSEAVARLVARLRAELDPAGVLA